MRLSPTASLGLVWLLFSTACDGHGGSAPIPRAPAPPAAPLSGEVGPSLAAAWLDTLPPAPSDGPLPFDVKKADYHAQVSAALVLDETEQALLQKNGFVIVDHDRRYTFASSYLGIYTRDLPVLVTTDSILHAYHRSYDALLRQLEGQWMAPQLELVLSRTRGELLGAVKGGSLDARTAQDVDDFLRVALALLVDPESETFGRITRRHYEGDLVSDLVDSAVQAEAPENIALRGGSRTIDFTQFAPRSHYTQSPALTRYFRTMMWLGRADTGFWLTAGDPILRVQVDADRELRAALLLSNLLEQAKALRGHQELASVFRALVGPSDNLTVDAMLTSQKAAGTSLAALRTELEKQPGAVQRVTSSMHEVPPGSAGRARLPMLFTLFGQGETLDARVLSEVVHDRIVVNGVAVPRMLPSPLDVAAALGNDQAARLLQPELERFAYAGQLAKLRGEIAAMPEQAFRTSLASGFLSALRTLHADDAAMPQAMRTSAWQRKMLGAELAAWSELRHDNVLLTKESYGTSVMCEYPYGYVEPYPAFYARMALLSSDLVDVLKTNVRDGAAGQLVSMAIAHFQNFARIAKQLEVLARKELRHQPFTSDEQLFLKKVAFNEAFGCVSRLTGWYAGLYLPGEEPTEWQPTVAAVHTAPPETPGQPPRMLHAGVGDARFMVAVIDSQDDLRTYVGPVYSYHESIEQGLRLTDEAWRQKLRGPSRPPTPSWLAELGGTRKRRALGPAAAAK